MPNLQQIAQRTRTSTPQPRYTAEEVAAAQCNQLPLFTFDLNYPKQVSLPAGRTIRRSTTIGVLSEEEARWIMAKVASVHSGSIAELAIAAENQQLKLVGWGNCSAAVFANAASYLATTTGPHPPSELGAQLANSIHRPGLSDRDHKIAQLLAAGALIARAIDILRKGH